MPEDDTNDVVDVQMFSKLLQDAIREINFFRINSINIKHKKNRRNGNRGTVVMGSEVVTITFTTAPGATNPSIDRMIGTWNRGKLAGLRKEIMKRIANENPAVVDED